MGGCSLQEEIVKRASQVRGGMWPAGSHTGFLSGCEDFPVSERSHGYNGVTQWLWQFLGSFVLWFTNYFPDYLRAGVAGGEAPCQGHNWHLGPRLSKGFLQRDGVLFSPVTEVAAPRNAPHQLAGGRSGPGLMALWLQGEPGASPPGLQG